MPWLASVPLATLQARYGDDYRWLLLLAVMAGTVASIIPSTSVNVAIPAISEHFGLGQDLAQWVTSGFMVASTIAMLTTPWLLQRFGYRATYAGAIVLLMLGGILGSVAQHFSLLLAARMAEGIAAGIIQPIPAVIILRAFQPHEQGRAGGLFGLGVVLAPAMAPALGGLLVEWMGWRSTFWMVIPPCILSLWLAWRYVPTTPPGGGTTSTNVMKFDAIGFALISTATLCLLSALTALHNSGGQAAALLLITAICLSLFIYWEKYLVRKGRLPLMDLRIYSYRSFVMGCIVAFMFGIAMFGSTYLIPMFIQLGLGLSASYAGNLLLPAGLVLAATIPLAGRLADRQPTHWLVSIGVVLLSLSFGLMLWVGASTALWVLAAFICIGRIGLGFILPSLNLGALRPVDKALLPQGSSTISFIRMLGGALGVGLCGIVLEWRLAVHAANTTLAPIDAHITAFHESFTMLTLLCLLTLLAATQLRAPIPKTSP